jgi:hypothetical protein
LGLEFLGKGLHWSLVFPDLSNNFMSVVIRRLDFVQTYPATTPYRMLRVMFWKKASYRRI